MFEVSKVLFEGNYKGFIKLLKSDSKYISNITKEFK